MDHRLIAAIFKVIWSPKQLDLVLWLYCSPIRVMRVDVFTWSYTQTVSREVHRLEQKLVKSVWVIFVVIIKLVDLLFKANKRYEIILRRRIYELLKPEYVLRGLFLKLYFNMLLFEKSGLEQVVFTQWLGLWELIFHLLAAFFMELIARIHRFFRENEKLYERIIVDQTLVGHFFFLELGLEFPIRHFDQDVLSREIVLLHSF